MKKIGVFIFLFFFMYVTPSFANDISKAVYKRNDEIWLWEKGQEKKLSIIGNIHGFQWSKDGKRLLYFKDIQFGQVLFVYNLDSDTEEKIDDNVDQALFHPNNHDILYTKNESLQLYKDKRIHYLATGVYSVQWFRNGNGIYVSSRADAKPDGWTQPRLYTKSKLTYENYFDANLLLAIPKEVKIHEKTLQAIHLEAMNESPSGKWISFIVSPWASWSMDENVLCLVDKNGKNFLPLDEVILHVGLPKWAPTKDILAYISGSGRLVYGFKDKKLKIIEAARTLTPKNYAELDFTWMDDKTIITSRVTEQEWEQTAEKRGKALLFEVTIDGKQHQLTTPPKGFGDYKPTWFEAFNKLMWFRATDLFAEKMDVWLGDKHGKGATCWLKNIEEIAVYEK